MLLPQQVEDHTRIEVARAGRHGNSAGRREPHRGVDGPPAAHRGQARAAAEGGSDRPFRHLVPELEKDRLVGEAVEAIAANTAVVELAWEGEARRRLWHRLVKRG